MATEATGTVESLGTADNGYNTVTKFLMALGWDLKVLRAHADSSDENMADMSNNEWRTQTIFLVLNDRDLFIGTVTFLAACITILMLFLLTIKFVFHLILMPKCEKNKLDLELPMYHKHG